MQFVGLSGCDNFLLTPWTWTPGRKETACDPFAPHNPPPPPEGEPPLHPVGQWVECLFCGQLTAPLYGKSLVSVAMAQGAS